MIARFSHRPAHSIGRRLLDAFRSTFVGGLGKSQRVYFVDINGQRYKRVLFGDSALAQTVVDAISTCGEELMLPKLFHQHENELWFEFVEGEVLKSDLPAHREALAQVFASLYSNKSVLTALGGHPIHRQLNNDLRFLHELGFLDPAQHARLTSQAETLIPEHAWFGLDYLDPVLKNFVLKDQQAVIIDLESIGQNALLGTGIAKSVLHWLDANERAAFTERVIELGAPDIRAQMDYAQLVLNTGWTKRKLLAGKRARAKLELFDQWLK